MYIYVIIVPFTDSIAVNRNHREKEMHEVIEVYIVYLHDL